MQNREDFRKKQSFTFNRDASTWEEDYAHYNAPQDIREMEPQGDTGAIKNLISHNYSPATKGEDVSIAGYILSCSPENEEKTRYTIMVQVSEIMDFLVNTIGLGREKNSFGLLSQNQKNGSTDIR